MAREPGAPGCALDSRRRGELVLGTASRVRRWLLVEQPGSWGSDALRESRIPEAVAEGVHRLAARHGARVVLVRRSMAPTTGAHQVFLVRSDRQVSWAERLRIREPEALLHLPLGALDADAPPGVGERVERLDLVCTNGRHDPCCADFGRPVVRVLRAAGQDVWESSHVGGDRFAANVVCLPSGVYFGRVPPERAVDILRDHADGFLALDHYRGRSCYPPLVQAAEVLARLELGERRLALLEPRAWTRDGDQITVELGYGAGALLATVSRHRGAAVALTCSATASDTPWEYRLERLEVRDPA